MILAITLLFPSDPPAIDVAVKKLYSVISGPAGQARDWSAFREMFVTDAKFFVVVKDAQGKETTVTMTPDDYVKRSGPYLEKNGFFEKEIARETRFYGGIAQVWTTYESRAKRDDKMPFARGINSVQLVKVGEVWKIASITWTDEATAGPIPKSYGG